jgi:hypothetical protein
MTVQRIQLRRDTAANWTSVNPILSVGEPAVETDTGRQKMGDGTTAWASLAYLVGAAEVSAAQTAAQAAAATDATGKVASEATRAQAAEALAASKSANLSDLSAPASARTNLGLGLVNNTADSAKPVSAAQAAADTAVQTAAAAAISAEANRATTAEATKSPAPTTAVPAWVTATAYPTVGQLVTNGGYFWSNKVSHTSGATFSGTTNWVQISPVLGTADGSAPLAVTAAAGSYQALVLGIDGSGIPYYDPAGAVPSQTANIQVIGGVPTLTQVGGTQVPLLSSSTANGTYAGLSGPASQWPMRFLGKKVRSIKGGTPGRVKWLTTWDSYSQKLVGAASTYLQNAIGTSCGAYFTGTTGTGSVSVNASTGTITDNTADFTKWISGLTSTFAAGATRTYGVGGSTFVGDKIKFYFINDGAGTFKVQVDGVDNTTPTVTADGSLGVVTIAAANAAHTVTIVGLTGTPTVVGPGYENTAASGMCFINVAQGGIGIEQPSAQAWTNFRTFLADVLPDVISFEAKETAATLTSSFDSYCTAITAGSPNTDVILIQSPPQSTAGADLIAQNVILRAKAVQYGFLTWDSYTPFKDYATITAMGMNGDGTHVSNDADVLRSLLLFRDMGIYQIMGVQPLDVQATNVSASTAVKLGITPSAPVLELDADTATDFDVTAKIKRNLTGKDSAGTAFFNLDSRNGTGTPSAVPKWMQVGIGQAGFTAFDGTLVYVKAFSGGNMNSPGAMYGMSFIPVTKAIALTVNGVVAMDAKLGGIQRVSLTANATSSTLANPVVDGHQLAIEWLQDATGGRTYVWPTNCRFAGGVAPSDTTASTMTRVEFLYDNTLGRWIEKCRAVAVPTT